MWSRHCVWAFRTAGSTTVRCVHRTNARITVSSHATLFPSLPLHPNKRARYIVEPSRIARVRVGSARPTTASVSRVRCPARNDDTADEDNFNVSMAAGPRAMELTPHTSHLTQYDLQAFFCPGEVFINGVMKKGFCGRRDMVFILFTHLNSVHVCMLA